MKQMFVLVSASSLMALNVVAAGSEAIIKQRAKDLSNQNNVRQGVAPPTQPPPTAPKPATTAPSTLTPQQALAKLQTDLAAIKVIVEEAGGCFTDLAGLARPDGGNACSTNGLLHADVLAAFAPAAETHR